MEEKERISTPERQIQIRKNGQFWGAFTNENRQIGNSQCRSCIIKVILKITKNSTIYDRIAVYNEDGSLKARILTGKRESSTCSAEQSGR